MRSRSALLAAGFAATAVLASAMPALAHDPDDDITDGTLAEAREATAEFLDIERALEEGYVQASPCEPGQGYHYVNPALADDDDLDVSYPEVLLYEPGPEGQLRLVGVEYVRFYPGSFTAPPAPPYVRDPDGPSMFGEDFHGPMAGHAPEMPDHHELHAWVWRHSPEGMFADHNSWVDCP